MAIRNIVKEGDSVLSKKCRAVETIDQRLLTLLDDMADTMYEANGVGLAAPQVGVLKRVVVIDTGDGLIEMINPEIIASEGSAVGTEGCLSVPGRWGEVERPEKVTVRYTDRDGEEFVLEAEGLLAVACCHELDHLDGHLFVEKVIRFVEVED